MPAPIPSNSLPSHSPKDVQREFYETGYGGLPADGRVILDGFAGLSPDSRISRAAALLQGSSGHFLDVGCGGGPLLYQVRAQFARLTGVDIAAVQLDRVRAWADTAGQPVELHRCNLDAEVLPLEGDSVDAAGCMVVLEFVIRPDHLVREVARVLRPGGVFVCSTGNIVSWRNRGRVLLGLDPQTTAFMGAVNGGALHHFTRATFINLLEQAGLVVEVVGCSGQWWCIRQYWPSLLGGDILVRARKV